jgi:hypothetical protein
MDYNQLITLLLFLLLENPPTNETTYEMEVTAPNSKLSMKTGEDTPSTRQPSLLSRYETAPPEEVIGQPYSE